MGNPWDNDPVVATPATTQAAAPANSTAPWENDPVAAPPKTIAPASVHQMVQGNQPQAEVGAAQQPAPFPQALDTGMGMPVSKMMAPQSPGTPAPEISAATRGHYVDAINNGTASSPADYAQQTIPAAASAVAPQPSAPVLISEAAMAGFRAALNIPPTAADKAIAATTTAPYDFSLGKPNLEKIEGKTIYGLTSGSPQLVGAIGGGLAGTDIGTMVGGPVGAAVGAAGGTFGGAALVDALKNINPIFQARLKEHPNDPNLAWSAAKKELAISAVGSGASMALFGISPFESTAKNIMFQALGVQPAIGAAQQASKNIAEGKPLAAGVAQAAGEAGMNTALPLAAHAGLHIIVHPRLAEVVGQATGKDPSTVTPQDIDQATAQVGQNSGMPHPKDFTDVSKIMYGDESGKSGLQNVYKESGIPPVQIYDDSQRDPSIAIDIAAGKIPAAYADKVDQNDIGAPKPPPGNPPAVGSKQLIGGGTVDHAIEHQLGTEEFAQHAASYPQTFEGMHQAAKDFVIQKGQETGNEHLVSLNDNGEATQHVERSSAGVAIPESLKGELNNPENKITLVHNHPYPVGVGPKDISFLGRPGAQAITAHTPSGETSTAALTDNMKQAISWLAPDHSKELLLDVGTKGFNEARNILKEYGQKNNMETGKGSPIAQVHNEIFNKAMAETGVTDYKYTDDHSSVLPKDVYNDILNKTADTIKERLASYDIKNEQPGRILGRGGSISELSAGRENAGTSGTEPGNNASGSGASGTNGGQGNQPPTGQEPPINGEPKEPVTSKEFAEDLAQKLHEKLGKDKATDILSMKRELQAKDTLGKELDEKFYLEKETPGSQNLTKEERELYEKHIQPLADEEHFLYKQIKELSGKEELNKESGQEKGPDKDQEYGYVHRIVKGKGHYLDKYDVDVGDDDDLGYGRPSGITQSTSSLKTPEFYAFEDSEGNRQFKAGEYPDGKKPGDKVIDEDGKQWTIQRAKTSEIEKNTDLEYYKSAIGNTEDNIRRLEKTLRNIQFLNDLKSDMEKTGFGTPPTAEDHPRENQQVNIPQLRGWTFDPRIAEVLNDVYDRGGQGLLQKINNFLIKGMFLNPIPHMQNVLYDYLGSRGFSNLRPDSGANYIAKGIADVANFSPEYIDVLKNGGALKYPAVWKEGFYNKLQAQFLKEMQSSKDGLDLAKSWGFESVPAMADAVFNGSQKALWGSGDALLMARIRELKDSGMSTPEAIEEAQKHIVDYRIPTRVGENVLGPQLSRLLSRALQSNSVVVFTRYHYGLFKSLGYMVKDAIQGAAEKDPGKVTAAAGSIFATMFLLNVVDPAISNLISSVTGQKEKMRRPGVVGLEGAIQDFSTGKKSFGNALQSQFITSPGLQVGSDLLHDKIINTDAGHIGIQALDYIMKQPTMSVPAIPYNIKEGKQTAGEEALRQVGITPAKEYKKRGTSKKAKKKFADEEKNLTGGLLGDNE